MDTNRAALQLELNNQHRFELCYQASLGHGTPRAFFGQLQMPPPQVGSPSRKRSVDDTDEPEEGPAIKKLRPALPETVNAFIAFQAQNRDGVLDNHHWPTDPATGQLVPEEEMGFNTPPPEKLRQFWNPEYRPELEGTGVGMIIHNRGIVWIAEHLHAPPHPGAPYIEGASEQPDQTSAEQSAPPPPPPPAKTARPRKDRAATKDKKGKGKATDKPKPSKAPAQQRRAPGRPPKGGQVSTSKAARKPKPAKKTPAPKGGRGRGRPRKDELSVAGKASKKTIAKKAPAPSTHAMRTRAQGPADQ